MIFRFNKKSRSGQSLVEAMIAASVLMVSMISIMTLLNSSLSVSRFVSDSYLGSYLASEGVEITKNFLDKNAMDIAAGLPVLWSNEVCDWANSAFQLDYNTTDLSGAAVRLGDKTVFSNTPIRVDADGRYQYAVGVDTKFMRTVKVDCSVPDMVVVTSIVSWKARGGSDSQVVVEDIFYNWR